MFFPQNLGKNPPFCLSAEGVEQLLGQSRGLFALTGSVHGADFRLRSVNRNENIIRLK